jgi:hypothetical protein
MNTRHVPPLQRPSHRSVEVLGQWWRTAGRLAVGQKIGDRPSLDEENATVCKLAGVPRTDRGLLNSRDDLGRQRVDIGNGSLEVRTFLCRLPCEALSNALPNNIKIVICDASEHDAILA